MAAGLINATIQAMGGERVKAKVILEGIWVDEQVTDQQLQFFDGLVSLGTVMTQKKNTRLL